MGISDEDFREAFKPLQIPAHYNADDTEQDKIIFSLASVGSGSVDDVVDELRKFDSSVNTDEYKVIAKGILNNLFDKGLINGSFAGGALNYNLSKITEANDGAVNPDLLAPGLD